MYYYLDNLVTRKDHEKAQPAHMKNSYFQSLAARLSLWIISLSALIFLAILSSNYFLSRQLLENYVGELAKKTAASTALELENTFQNVASHADSLASLVATTHFTESQINQSIKAFLNTSPDIFGMAVALEPNTLIPSLGDFSPYYYRKNNAIAFSDLATDDYQYKKWPWYNETKKQLSPIWSEPYLDEGGGNVLMTTYSTPIFINEKDKKFAGVATADIELSWLDETVKNIKVGESGFGFIVSKNDIIIAHPNSSLNMKSLFEASKPYVSPENWQKYLTSKSDNTSVYFYSPCRHQDGFCWVAIEALGNTQWKIIIVFPEQELISKISALTLKSIIIAILGLTILFIVISFLARRLTQPLANLAAATKYIGAGKLDIELPAAKHQDEIGALSDDFNTMRQSLKKHINDIQVATAKQQKLESEIQIAKDIQMSMIPGGGDISVDDDSYRLYARLIPARSVGGDLYYYQKDNDTLNFIIGDVSDKGVPAALFMAKTITLYTRALKDRLSPGATFSMMNDVLVQNNDACMFVTALCGNINLKTGNVVMSNAGHMNPLIQGIETTTEQSVDGATALGLMDDVDYPDISFQLNHKAALVMYTDGISEAHDINNEQYTDERLIEFLSNLQTDSAETTNEQTIDIEKIGKKIMQSVSDFSTGTEQFDDITLLIIQTKEFN